MIIKGFFGILLFIFFLFVLIAMLTGGYIVRTIKKMRKAAEQAADLKAQRYRDETGRQRQQYSQRQQRSQHSQDSQHSQNAQHAQDGEPSEARRTQTATGETVIDHRHQERENKKIFDDSEGDYVDFEEA
jgi:Flp pilus assembly protein TadG